MHGLGEQAISWLTWQDGNLSDEGTHRALETANVPSQFIVLLLQFLASQIKEHRLGATTERSAIARFIADEFLRAFL